jgi:hypothetical protein
MNHEAGIDQVVVLQSQRSLRLPCRLWHWRQKIRIPDVESGDTELFPQWPLHLRRRPRRCFAGVEPRQ